MKRICDLSIVILLVFIMTSNAQMKNPRGLEFTWRTDTSIHNIDLSEISLVLPQGSFPKIDYPDFLAKGQGLEAFFVHEPVISVEIGGEAKAYPLNMLTTHEISNDNLGGIPILATYCPLCNASVVYDRRIEVGGIRKTLEFEVSGMLRKSDMVMLDTDTESLWQQLMGEAIVGSYTGTFLTVIPSMIISVQEFFKRYPNGEILSNVTPDEKLTRQYGNNPYVGYDSEDAAPYMRYFETSQVDPRLPAMERVIDIEVNGAYKIYPFTRIAEQGVLMDRFKNLDLLFFHSDQTVSVLDSREISTSKSIGSITVFNAKMNGQLLTFSKAGSYFKDDQSGSKWDITGLCVKGELKGSQLTLIPYSNHFAFAWLAFFPESEIYE